MRQNLSLKDIMQRSREESFSAQQSTEEFTYSAVDAKEAVQTDGHKSGLEKRSFTLARIAPSPTSSNLITALHRQSSFVNGPQRTMVQRIEFTPEILPEKTPRDISKFQRFEPRITHAHPTLLNFRNIVFESYGAAFTTHARPERIIEFFLKSKCDAVQVPYKTYNWETFRLEIAEGPIYGANNAAESDSTRKILDEESSNHIKLFGHDEYYKYYMWLKFENNNDYFNYYVGELTAVQWQIQVVQDAIAGCYLQELK